MMLITRLCSSFTSFNKTAVCASQGKPVRVLSSHISLESLRVGSDSCLPHWRYHHSTFSGHFDYPKAQGQMCPEVQMP